jgi:hypothetical protein
MLCKTVWRQMVESAIDVIIYIDGFLTCFGRTCHISVLFFHWPFDLTRMLLSGWEYMQETDEYVSSYCALQRQPCFKSMLSYAFYRLL